MEIRTDFVNNIGMQADAAYLNAHGAQTNENTDALNGKKLWTGTASAYASIVTKDANTIYVVTP